MSLDNFRNRTIIWDTVNRDFPQPIQIMQGDVNARTLLIKIVDNGVEIDLTGHSLKLTYQYTNSSNSGFVMIPPKDLAKGEFILVIPTEMTTTGVIEANLILLNEDKEQVIVSKNLTFISDNSTVSDLAQEVNNKIDDFTKLLLGKMPQVLRSELNDLHAQTDSNKSNIELKANLADMTSLQSAMTELKKEVEAFGISPENLVTIKSLLDAIASNASESEVVELINSVKVLTSNISLMSNGDYSPKANQTDLESLQHTVNNQSATVSTKANQTDLDNLQATVDKQGVAISTKAEQSELSITNKNVATAQETANKAESEAKNAMAKATESQANSLPLNGNAVSASKLATARKLGVSLQASTYQNFDGTADVTNVGVSGVLPIANGGTGNIGAYAYGLNCYTNTTDFSSGLKIYTKAVNTNQSHMFILQSAWAKYAPISGVYIVICSVTNSGSNGDMSMTALANGTIYTATVPYIYTEPTITTQAIYTTTATPNWAKVLNANEKGTDYAQAHPVGSVVSNSSNSSSGYTTGTWQNIGSAVIGSTTIYYWKRTA
ncbi:neck passage structure [Lactococcus phage 63302]|uniref:Neck passage structure n=1 Tax=Lactococcus phage 63302 TaxID=2029670 RepID=A0A343JQ80_9CAUD|nr:neck passage structure [Lactococcus phage 63302]ASZ71653.1 neck passage structure [Lactococcus phage 63302]